jgi:hypothetical protein
VEKKYSNFEVMKRIGPGMNLIIHTMKQFVQNNHSKSKIQEKIYRK